MNINERIESAAEKIKDSIDIDEKAGFEDIASGISTIYSNGLLPKSKASDYLKSATGWVYSCVNVIADEIASAELRMVKVDKNGDNPEEVNTHPALDVIYRANNAMTRFDLLQLTTQYLELCGEAPWYISFKGGKPDQIFLLRPDRLTVLPGNDGELIGGYKYKVYTTGGAYEELTLDPLEVVLLRYSDPNNPVRGKGPLQAAAKTVDLDNYGETWNSQFFRNSASPSAAFSTDKKLGKEQRARLEKKINQKYATINNAHKTLILESGLKFEKISLSQKDMDFIEQQRFSRDKVFAIFRVPTSVVGLVQDVTRANAEATDYVFAKRTIRPKLLRIEEQLNEFFLPLFGTATGAMFFEFENPVPENVDQNIAKATNGVTNGYVTINEAREMIGLDPIDGGDVLRDPASMNPLFNPNDNSQLTAVPKRKKPTTYQKQSSAIKNRGVKNQEKKMILVKEIVSRSIQPIILNLLQKKAESQSKKENKRVSVKSVLTSGTFEEAKKAKYDFQEKQLNLADSYLDKMIKKLDTVFQKQKEIVLRGLDNGDKMILNVDKETERYIETLQSTMIDLMRKQAGLAFQFLGIQKSITTKTFLQTLLQYYGDRTFTFASGVTRETNDKLRNAFSLAAENGESIPQIKTRVSELFDGMEGYRSERIARTETIRSSNFATNEAYKESGVVEAKEWLTTKDERTDDECLAKDGTVIPLDSEFQTKKENGYEKVEFPPLHVNCRCTLIPVLGTPYKEGTWRPSMNQEQADAFSKDSQIKGKWLHGTNKKAADDIKINGFRPSKNLMGPEAVYFGKDPAAAQNYADAAAQIHKDSGTEVLNVRFNLNNVKTFETEEQYLAAIEAKYGDWTKETMTEFNNQFDAVLIKKTQDRGLNYLMVRDPRNITVIR